MINHALVSHSSYSIDVGLFGHIAINKIIFEFLNEIRIEERIDLFIRIECNKSGSDRCIDLILLISIG